MAKTQPKYKIEPIYFLAQKYYQGPKFCIRNLRAGWKLKPSPTSFKPEEYSFTVLITSKKILTGNSNIHYIY